MLALVTGDDLRVLAQLAGELRPPECLPVERGLQLAEEERVVEDLDVARLRRSRRALVAALRPRARRPP